MDRLTGVYVGKSIAQSERESEVVAEIGHSLSTEQAIARSAIARSVDCECPISAVTSDSLLVRAIAFRLGDSLPYADTFHDLQLKYANVVLSLDPSELL